jgi:hypothetical protein
MRTNRTFAANCAATLASARSNFGGVCHTKKIYGSTRRGLAGVALATSSYIPLMFTLDDDLHLQLHTKRYDLRRGVNRLVFSTASAAAFERRPGGLVHVASSVMGPASETRHMNRHARAYPARQKPLIKL